MKWYERDMTQTQSRVVRWAVRCIGFVIFGYLLHKIGPAKLWRTIRSVEPIYFFMALPIFFAMIGVKTLKMRFLMRHPMRFSELYDLNAFGFSVGSVTPGRLGEFSKIIFLSRFGVPVSESFAVTLIDRLSDVIGMIVCAVFGLYIFFGDVAGRIGLTVVVGVAAAGLILWFSDRILRQILWGKLKELVELEGGAIRSYVRQVPYVIWELTLGCTVLYLGLYFLQMWILARGLHLPISYIQTTMAISASAIPAILPISVFNVGPRDYVLTKIFENMGWGAEGGLALSTMILFLFLVNGIFGLFFIPRRPSA